MLIERRRLLCFVLVSCLLLGITFSRSTSRYNRRSSQDGIEVDACTTPPSLQMLKFLDRICEDCYRLYRDVDIYQMCRSDCYGTEYFLGCMESIMVSPHTRTKAAHFLNLINN